MIPHVLHLWKWAPSPPQLIAMESRNILAKNQISPHTLSTTDFYKIVYYSHLLHSIITALYYFIKLAPQVTISYPKMTPQNQRRFL